MHRQGCPARRTIGDLNRLGQRLDLLLAQVDRADQDELVALLDARE